MPVRLDPFRRIVGVSWSGGDGGLPPEGDLLIPFIWDWAGFRNGNDGGSLALNFALPNFFEDVPADDMIVAQLASDIAPGDPHPQVTITPNEPGWFPMWHLSTLSAVPGFGFTQTAAAWARVKQAGDQAVYTFNYSPDAPRTGLAHHIVDNWPGGLPHVVAAATSDGTDLATAPSLNVGRQKVGLFALLDADSNFNPFGKYPGAPEQNLSSLFTSFGSQNGHIQMGWDEEFTTGPGATGDRVIASSPGTGEVVGHFAVLGKPA